MRQLRRIFSDILKFGSLIFVFFIAFQNCGEVEIQKPPEWGNLNPLVVEPPQNIIVSKGNVSCNVIGGEAKCWGAFNQNPPRPLADSLLPVKIPLLSNGIKSVTVGEFNMCVLSQTGGVKCWGSQISSLGAGREMQASNNPVDVAGLNEGVKDIAGGIMHTCALLNTGGVKCWGYLKPNSHYFVPVDIPGLTSGVVAISAGTGHTCALMNTGGVKCWGLYNEYGELGNGTTGPSAEGLTPTDVLGLTSGVKAISAGGYTTCALTTTGGMKCWGFNNQGQIGDSSFIKTLVPKDIESLTSGIKAISAGGLVTCALLIDGTVKCLARSKISTIQESSAEIELISVGQSHACLLLVGGKTKCWGSNYYGQLGNNSQTNSEIPIPISE